MTWDASGWQETGTFELLDEYRPAVTSVPEGDALVETYCSHWFTPRPGWDDGGQLAAGQPTAAAAGHARRRAVALLRPTNLGLVTQPGSRHDGRAFDQLRAVSLTRGWLDHAEGSCLVEFGRTRVLVAASATEGVPRWRKGSGLGWVTAEYAMLPRATHTRTDRESVRGKVGGRTHEISRLVGRSLRATIDLKLLGERTIAVDCDVLQADGGTRTAAITGAYVALADACAVLGRSEAIVRSVAAVSVGVVDGLPALDLDYPEDVSAGTDMNVVATGDGALVEVQGTAEGMPFSRAELDVLLDLALAGTAELTSLQASALAQPLRRKHEGDPVKL